MARNESHFKFDAELTRVLGDSYRSTEDALKELIDNAWDADARRVEVTLPELSAAGVPIIIADDGTGMMPQEVEDAYLTVASSRASRKGNLTTSNRRVKGRKGVGKFAGLAAASLMRIETRARGKLTQFEVGRDALRIAGTSLEQIPIVLEVTDSNSESGTTVFLIGLDQNRTFPSPDKLKRKLVYDYGHQDEFEIYVNGERVGVTDIEGDSYVHYGTIGEVGAIDLTVLVATSKTPPKGSGIVLKVNGKMVGGEPSYFGLDEDDEIPKKLLKRLQGEVHADGLEDAVTADWGALSESSVGYQKVQAFVRDKAKEALKKQYQAEFSLVKARRQREIDRVLSRLPENRRVYAMRELDSVFNKFYGDQPERVDAIIDISLKGFEVDDYWSVIRSVEEARESDVGVLALALEDFGIADTASFAKQVRSRLKILDDIDALVFNAATTEAEVHTALEENTWVFGPSRTMVSSNTTTKRLLKEYLDKEFKGKRASKRPDLLIARNARDRHTLIELKRPNVTLNRDHESQLLKYGDDLASFVDGQIDMVLIGGKRGVLDQSGKVEVRTYVDVIAEARDSLTWLLEDVTS